MTTTAADVGRKVGHRLGINWRMDRQEFFFDDEIFINEGSTNTNPVHDLAHLLVAANGGLIWRPVGDDSNRRLAEYNAIFVEALLDAAYCSALGKVVPGQVIPLVRQHARWLVEKHYSPFPMRFEEAFFELSSRLKPEIISRLCPLYFDQKTVENGQLTRPITAATEQCSLTEWKDYKIGFKSTDAPTATGLCVVFQGLVRNLLEQLLIEHKYPMVSCTSHFACD